MFIFISCVNSIQDALENVSHELKYIFKTGYYHFGSTTSDGRNSIQLRLHYQAESATKRQPRVDRQDSTSAEMTLNEVKLGLEDPSLPDKTETLQTVLEQWGSEQIMDFVQKLGYVESKEDEEQIQHFLVLNEVLIQSHHVITLCACLAVVYSRYSTPERRVASSETHLDLFFTDCSQAV